MKSILIYDTTLRDGEQAPGFSMTAEEKLVIALQLEQLKVDVIEAGFPFSNKMDLLACQMIAKEIKETEISLLSRLIRREIDISLSVLKTCQKGRLHIFGPVSQLHIKKKFNKDPYEFLSKITSSIKYARNNFSNIQFGCEDATRAHRDFLYHLIEKIIACGVSTITLADTIGCSTPWEIDSLVSDIKNNVPNIDKVKIAIHCHNDLGLAVANTLAGINAGAEQAECTINGIGERAGNASLEEVTMALDKTIHFRDYTTQINKKLLFPISKLLADITGQNVQSNKAIVGTNAFMHGAGIHQHGLNLDKRTYEFISPEEVGSNLVPFFLGKHSGRHGLINRLKELNINLLDENIDILLNAIKSKNFKETISDEGLKKIVETTLKAHDGK